LTEISPFAALISAWTSRKQSGNPLHQHVSSK
jgi:hypothetical protein